MESVVDLIYVIILLWSSAFIIRSFAYICISLGSRGEMQWNKRGSDVMSGPLVRVSYGSNLACGTARMWPFVLFEMC
jgi:hypothetical protein